MCREYLNLYLPLFQTGLTFAVLFGTSTDNLGPKPDNVYKALLLGTGNTKKSPQLSTLNNTLTNHKCFQV